MALIHHEQTFLINIAQAELPTLIDLAYIQFIELAS